MMSSEEKDYSYYLNHLQNVISITSLVSGFLFTAYTILITLLSDPSTIIAQVTLLTISIYLSIAAYCIATFADAVFRCCPDVPPMSKLMKITNLLFFAVVTTAEGIAIILMSLLWNLVYLALAQAIQWTLSIAATYQFTLKRTWEFRKSKA